MLSFPCFNNRCLDKHYPFEIKNLAQQKKLPKTLTKRISINKGRTEERKERANEQKNEQKNERKIERNKQKSCRQHKPKELQLTKKKHIFLHLLLNV